MSDKTAAPAKVEAKAIDTRKKMFKVRLYSRAIIMGYKRYCCFFFIDFSHSHFGIDWTIIFVSFFITILILLQILLNLIHLFSFYLCISFFQCFSSISYSQTLLIIFTFQFLFLFSSQRNQKPNTSLVKIQGVNCAHDTDFYIGKKIAYVYTVGKRIRGQKPHKRYPFIHIILLWIFACVAFANENFQGKKEKISLPWIIFFLVQILSPTYSFKINWIHLFLSFFFFSFSNNRVIWGKVTRRHGMNGVVRAKFQVNLPPKSFGQRARVMLYPSKI